MPTFRVAVPYDRLQETRVSAEEDAALVARYGRSRDRDALDELVRRHWAEAHRLALLGLADPAAAEDAAQEALVALVRGAGKFDPARPFGPWFRTLVMNAVRMSRRARGRRQRHESFEELRMHGLRQAHDGPGQGQNEAEAALLSRELLEHVARLPEDERFAIVLHYYEGRSHEEVATVQGCPRGTASSRIRRGLTRLRESLAGAGYTGSLEALEKLLTIAHGEVVPVPPPSAISVEALAAKAVPWMASGLAIKVASLFLAVVLLASAVLVNVHRPPAQGPRDQAIAPARSQDAGARTVRQDGGMQDVQQGGDQGTTAQSTTRQGTASLRDGDGKPAVAPSSTIAIEGPGFLVTVTDASGKPVPGTRVEARHHDIALMGFPELMGRVPVQCMPEVHSCTADKNGQAFLSAREGTKLAMSSKVVVVATSGVGEAVSEPFSPPADLRPVGLVLRSPASPKEGCGSVILTVTTPAGPLANTELSGSFSVSVGKDVLRFTGVGFDGETDAEGRLVFHDLLPGMDMLSFQHDSYQQGFATFRVDAGCVTEKSIALDPGAVLAGRVCQADGSTPQHPVTAFFLEKINGMSAASLETYEYLDIPVDTKGSYRTNGLAPGLYTVKAWAPGQGMAAALVQANEPGTFTVPDLVLGQKGALVTGRVSGPEGPRSFVFLEDAENGLLGGVRATDDGRFAIACVPEGSARVLLMPGPVTDSDERMLTRLCLNEASAAVELLAKVQVPAQGELALGDLSTGALPDVATFKGRVFGPDGQPVVGANVVLASTGSTKEVSSDAGGAFEIVGLAPGDDSLAVTSGDLVNLQPTSVHLVPGENDLDVTLAPGGSVSGTVSPLPENKGDLMVVAFLCGPDGEPTSSDRSVAMVGEDGRYRLHALRPGRYKVQIPSFHEPVSVAVVSGREETLDLSLSAGTGEIVVHVQGTAVGAIALRGTLSFRSVVLDPLARAAFTDGKALLVGLPQGTVTVLVSIRDGTPEDMNDRLMLFREGIAIGTASHQEIDLALPDQSQAGRLSGQVSPAPDKRGAQCMVLVRGDGVLLTASIKADGSFTLPSVPPGNYTVEALSMKALFADKLSANGVPVTVLAKQAATLSLTLN